MSDLTSILDRWEPVIGLEVHAQLSTKSKMFCGCQNKYGSKPNSNKCPTSSPDLEQPAYLVEWSRFGNVTRDKFNGKTWSRQ